MSLMCDFCSKPMERNEGWALPTESFTMDIPGSGPAWGSKGDWAACDRCLPIVESRDQVKLLDLALKGSGVPRQMWPVIRPGVKAMHEKFFLHWGGNVNPNKWTPEHGTSYFERDGVRQ